MQLKQFNGGLSLRIDPTLLAPQEALLYNNVDVDNIALKSAKSYNCISQNVESNFYKLNDTFLSGTGYLNYTEYKGVVYFTRFEDVPGRFDGVTITNMGIERPEIALEAEQENPPDSNVISTSQVTLQYVYTYYSTTTGLESAPSDISNELTLDANKIVSLVNFRASSNDLVDTIRLYRIGAGITTMQLVKELPNVGDTLTGVQPNQTPVKTIFDNTPTIDIIGTILDTYSNLPPKIGFKNFTEAYGIMFASLGSRLYFSQIGKVEYWPEANFIEFAEEITMILPTQDGLIVSSRSRTDLLIGTTIADFAVVFVSREHGSLYHFSGKLLNGIPIWIAQDGLATFVNGSIKILSKNKLGTILIDAIDVTVDNENYYISRSDGSLLALDARFNEVYKTFTFDKNVKYLGTFGGKLYASLEDKKVVELFTGDDDLTFTYLSPIFDEGSSTIVKMYNSIYISLNGQFEITIYIDGESVLQRTINGNDVFELNPPYEKQRGYNIQFKIVGKGVIREIEYKVLGRANGR